MSAYNIYYNKDGAKMMRPVRTRDEYLALRGTQKQKDTLGAVRNGHEQAKRHLVQMNYSCLPNEDGSLKGTTSMSSTVGMDIDHVPAEEMETVKRKILDNVDALGLLMLERSARAAGYHLVFLRHPEMSQEDNLRWASDLLGVAYDGGAKDITRVFYTTTDNAEELIFLDDRLFESEEVRGKTEEVRGKTEEVRGKTEEVRGKTEEVRGKTEEVRGKTEEVRGKKDEPEPLEPLEPSNSQTLEPSTPQTSETSQTPETPQTPQTPQTSQPLDPSVSALEYNGIPYTDIIRKWWELYNEGKEPVKSNRDVLTFELAVNLRHICGFDRTLLDKLIPCYDGFPEAQKLKCIDSALSEKRTQMPKRLRDVLNLLQRDLVSEGGDASGLEEAMQEDDCFYYNRLPRMPQGVRDSVEAVGPMLSMPAVTAICPAIGMLATGVELDVHGQKKGLNLISYIAGDFASGKGSIDPVMEAWMGEVKALDDMYIRQEEEWRAKKRAAKNKKEQPEEPKLPVRYLPLNNTVANLAERLANTDGKHAFSFTPEADTVAQKWKSAMSDFSVMLRQSYDGSRYDREARSADAVNVHIARLLWNVTMCGTPDALYRVVSNYTDGFQSRIAVARTPDNTFKALEDKPYVLTERQREHIQQIAHLLPLMQGQVTLPKLEERGRQWVENIRIETMKNDDKVRARQRFRTCVTAQRMTCCIMLCQVAEQLIQKHGFAGAEKHLKEHPDAWKQLLQKAQTPHALDTYDVIADYLIDTALHFFRDRIENAFTSRDYVGNGDRQRVGKNDSIYERLDCEFSLEGAYQHSVAVKGANVTRNSVKQMLKNWKNQGLIVQSDWGTYRKV